MNTWLHFIGKSYYSELDFIKEAKQFGISRRVRLSILKQMQFGDRVLLAMMQGKTPVIIGEFVINELTGLDTDIVQGVITKYGGNLIDMGGMRIERGCGMYITGCTYETKASIQEILQVADKSGVQCKPMVGGRYREFPKIRLLSVPYTRGFRLFDYEAFQEALINWNESERYTYPAIRGLFYVSRNGKASKSKPSKIDSRTRQLVQAVYNYQQN